MKNRQSDNAPTIWKSEIQKFQLVFKFQLESTKYWASHQNTLELEEQLDDTLKVVRNAKSKSFKI